MKITKLPDQLNPRRLSVKVKGNHPTPHLANTRSVNPMWDERQRALIEEFKKVKRNDAK